MAALADYTDVALRIRALLRRRYGCVLGRRGDRGGHTHLLYLMLNASIEPMYWTRIHAAIYQQGLLQSNQWELLLKCLRYALYLHGRLRLVRVVALSRLAIRRPS